MTNPEIQSLIERLNAPEKRARMLDWHDFPDGHSEGPFDPLKIEAAAALQSLMEERDDLKDQVSVWQQSRHAEWLDT